MAWTPPSSTPIPQRPGIGVRHDGQGVEQAVEVVDAVADAAVEAVAQQIVHLVDVELARNDLGEKSTLRGNRTGEQARRRPPASMPSPWRSKRLEISSEASRRAVIAS